MYFNAQIEANTPKNGPNVAPKIILYAAFHGITTDCLLINIKNNEKLDKKILLINVIITG
jgi:hypothetical protein